MLVTVDRAQLADFLRSRREALQPEDVGMPRGPRRRTDGLRREEVAVLAGMSTDYLTRLEQQRGPQPSEQMLAAIARGLRLSIAERDHLFRIAGHEPPVRPGVSDHVAPGLMRVLDRLQDTPAQVISSVGETLVQTPPSVGLFGDETRHTGLARATVYRWFTEPASRDIYPADDHDLRGRVFTSDLRTAYARDGERSRAGELVRALSDVSAEFRAVWETHEVGLAHGREKRFAHPELGAMTLDCQVLNDPHTGQGMLVFTATPGTESAEKLALLAVLGAQRVGASAPNSRR